MVDTDSQLVRDLLAREFPEIVCLERPTHLLDDPPMNEILLYDTTHVAGDFYIQTHVTNPFLRAESVEAAIESFLLQYPIHCDSLFSVRQLQTRLYDQLGRAINHNPAKLLRTQDLPPGRYCTPVVFHTLGVCGVPCVCLDTAQTYMRSTTYNDMRTYMHWSHTSYLSTSISTCGRKVCSMPTVNQFLHESLQPTGARKASCERRLGHTQAAMAFAARAKRALLDDQLGYLPLDVRP